MPNPLTPIEANGLLDEYDWYEDAKGPGVYRLKLAIPSDPKAVWSQEFDVAKAAWTEQLRAAERLVYVGEAQDIYSRIMEHCKRDTRKVRVMNICPPVDIHGVTPVEASQTRRKTVETNTAVKYATEDTVTWCNGVLR